MLWQQLHLSVLPGERLMVVGPSGAGKSLLLRQLAGLDSLQEGQILLRGREQGSWPMPQFRAQVIYLPQRASMPGAGQVLDALKRPFLLREHAGRRFDEERAAVLLERLGRTPAFLRQSAEQLSGGELQLVALTRALLLSPSLLLLGEATSALDPETGARAEALLREWSEEDQDGKQAGRAWLAILACCAFIPGSSRHTPSRFWA